MNDFFQTLLRPDREDPNSKERDEVARAADVLMVGEFQFLQLAYYEWHGDDLPVELVDKLFAAYMLKNHVPHWARHYARLILEKDARGFIDPHDPAYHRYDAEYVTHVPEGVKRFTKAAVFLILVVGGAVWIGQMAAAKNVPFQFPPYTSDATVEAPAERTPGDTTQKFQTNP